MNLVSLQLKTTNNFEEILQNLADIIEKIEPLSLILAPELALSGYAYDKMDEAFEISQIAIKLLTKLSSNKTIAITFIIKQNTTFYNTFYLFHKGKIIHTQSKHKLFILNDENKYFTSGDETN
ncbi:MAG: carbon-nitrogen hydrolase family protein, partial [Arcobacter sp.]|nr:carbon-nitrogen hydrolase family protein [Arcobacter sp.]